MIQKRALNPTTFALALIFSAFFSALALPGALAAGFDVQLIPVKDVITESQSAAFLLTLTNNDANVAYEIFSLSTDFSYLGETLTVPTGFTKQTELKVYPRTDKSGVYEVTVFVRNQFTRDLKEVTARVRLLTLKDSLSMYVDPALLQVSDDKLTFIVKNRADNDLENIKLEVSSPIFSRDFEFSAVAKEEKRYEISVNLEEAEGGQHDIHVKGYQNDRLAFEKDVPYTLEEIYEFDQSRSITGFLVREKRLTSISISVAGLLLIILSAGAIK